MRKAITQIKLTDTLTLSECHDGWWLYDTTRGCNLSMRAKTERAAFVDALMYYQTYYNKMKNEYGSLSKKVEDFISLFRPEDEE
jgi:hypothetical protein